MTAMFLNEKLVIRCSDAVAGSSVRVCPVVDAAIILVVSVLVCLLALPCIL